MPVSSDLSPTMVPRSPPEDAALRTVEMEDVLERFDRAWQQETPPELNAFLPTPGSPGEYLLLVGLVHIDLEYRSKRGESVRIEQYLDRYPRLAEDSRTVLGLLEWEFELRRRQEPNLTREDVLGRFPELAKTLRQQSNAARNAGPVERPEIPGYEILEELGRGGMGVVYRARQIGLGRDVALKVIRSGDLAGPQERARFQREAEAVAAIRHPGIVQVHDFGEIRGRPFFALEFCTGGSLFARLVQGLLSGPEAARLVEQVALAVQAAHDAGIVHRDLKPANVLLDAEERPRVADFGLARRIDVSGLTQTGDILGTPAYMAPEQARGDRNVGAPADIYALGAILYECLTGRPPFRAASVLETLAQVTSAEPVAVRTLNPAVPRDLETICHKALRKVPADRYASANDLADDLRRWLNGESILARPVSVAERMARWAWRHRLAMALLGVSLLAVLGWWAGMQFRRWGQEAQRDAQAARERADREQQEREETERRAALEKERQRWRLSWEKLNLLGERWAADPIAVMGELEDAETFPPAWRDFGWRCLYNYCQRMESRVGLGIPEKEASLVRHSFSGPNRSANGVRFSPDGSTLCVVGGTQDKTIGEVLLCNAGSLKIHQRIMVKGGKLAAAAYSPDGKLLATGSADGVVHLHDASTGAVVARLTGHDLAVRSLAFSPDGRTLASASCDCTVRLWDVPTRKPRHTLFHHKAFAVAVAWSRDGRSVITGAWDGHVCFWDAATGKLEHVQELGGVFVHCLACSPDGKTLACGCSDGRLVLLDAVARTVRSSVRGHGTWVFSVAFSRDGRYLATASHDGSVRLWFPETGLPGLTLAQQKEEAKSVAFAPNGRQLAAAFANGTIRVWDAPPAPELVTSPPDTILPSLHGPVWSAVRRPGGHLLAFACSDGVRLVDPRDLRQPFALLAHPEPVYVVAYSRDGNALFTAGKDGIIRHWDVESRRLMGSYPALSGLIRALAVAPDGRTVASGHANGSIRLLDLASGKELRTFTEHEGLVNGLAYSPDGSQLASAGNDRSVRIWDPSTGMQTAFHQTGSFGATCVRFSPDGKSLASGWFGGSIRFLDPSTGGLQRMWWLAARGGATGLDFSSDGRLLAAGGFVIGGSGAGSEQRGVLKVWNLTTGKLRARWQPQPMNINGVVFTQDGSALIAVGFGDQGYLWRLTHLP